MRELPDLLWIEFRKALRSKIPLWTSLASLFMPLGMALLIWFARNPELTQRLGLVSAKANLIAYSATDWSSYLVLYNQIVGMGGFFFFVMGISWIFGREFTDGTLKDMLAVPVERASILLAKFLVAIAWSAGIAVLIILFGFLMGAVLKLPGGSPSILLHGVQAAAITACLVIATILPFALFASIGRGFLLPLGVTVLTMISANLLIVIGLAEYFPWAVPMIFAQGEIPLSPVSYWIVILTGLAGVMLTIAWWKYADQSR